MCKGRWSHTADSERWLCAVHDCGCVPDFRRLPLRGVCCRASCNSAQPASRNAVLRCCGDAPVWCRVPLCAVCRGRHNQAEGGGCVASRGLQPARQHAAAHGTGRGVCHPVVLVGARGDPPEERAGAAVGFAGRSTAVHARCSSVGVPNHTHSCRAHTIFAHCCAAAASVHCGWAEQACCGGHALRCCVALVVVSMTLLSCDGLSQSPRRAGVPLKLPGVLVRSSYQLVFHTLAWRRWLGGTAQGLAPHLGCGAACCGPRGPCVWSDAHS
jgi:hypothetical protein